MVVFSLALTDSTDVVKLEVIKVADVTYVRITYKGNIYKGYIMLSTKNGNSIYELNAECKFPE